MIARIYILLILVFISGCKHLPPPETAYPSDAELKRLEAALNKAMTQTDMNEASGKISEFWDTRLAVVEQKVEKTLEDAGQKEYSKAKARWYDYRTSEVKFRASLYEGGSIQPLMANLSYSEITRQRVEELQSALDERSGLVDRP